VPQTSTIGEPPREEPQKEAPPEEPKAAEPASKEAVEEAVEPDPEAEKLLAKYGGEQTLKITIVSAQDLRNADFIPGAGKSDPFCVCEVKRKPELRFQTPVVNDQLNPSWGHEGCFEKFSAGDSLRFIVSDQDVVGADFLGEATLERGTFEHGFEGHLPLDVRGKGPETSSLHVRVEALVPIQREGESTEVPILEAEEGAVHQPKGLFCCG
jgi:Ca2+-dependent lipid-binding protein